jgi:hypothetical protein
VLEQQTRVQDLYKSVRVAEPYSLRMVATLVHKVS